MWDLACQASCRSFLSPFPAILLYLSFSPKIQDCSCCVTQLSSGRNLYWSVSRWRWCVREIVKFFFNRFCGFLGQSLCLFWEEAHIFTLLRGIAPSQVISFVLLLPLHLCWSNIPLIFIHSQNRRSYPFLLIFSNWIVKFQYSNSSLPQQLPPPFFTQFASKLPKPLWNTCYDYMHFPPIPNNLSYDAELPVPLLQSLWQS